MTSFKVKVALVLVGIVFLFRSNDHHGEVLAMGISHKVSYCPRDEKEWQKASNRLNCSDDVTDVVNRYHCLPTDSLTTLLEFCYNRTRANVINGLCMVYFEKKNILNHYNCGNFKEGCPNTWYRSDEMFKFPACLEIEPTKHCYKAEASCIPTTRFSTEVLNTTLPSLNKVTSKSPTAGTNDGQYYLIAFLLILIGIIIAFVVWKKGRKMRRCFGHKETAQTCEQNSLLENGEKETAKTCEQNSLLETDEKETAKTCEQNSRLETDEKEIEALIDRFGINYLLKQLPDDQRMFPKIAEKLRIPLETLNWSLENRRDFVRAMKRGKISVYSGRGMVIGCAGAGKTTLVKKLKGEDMREDPKSTSGIEIHTHAFKLVPDESTIIACTDKEKSESLLCMTPGMLQNSEDKKREKASVSVIEEEFPNQINAISTIQTQFTDDQSAFSISSEPRPEVINEYNSDVNNEIIHEDSQSIQPANYLIGPDVVPDEYEKSDTNSKQPVEISDSDTNSQQPVEIIDCIPSANEKDLKMLSLLDFAGQSAYYACHHIFFSPRAFFILVIDITKKLKDVATEACREENLIYSNWTYKDYVRYWLGSIHTYSSKTAPIILVFSHAEHNEADPKEAMEYYKDICKCLPKPLLDHVDIKRMYSIMKNNPKNMEDLMKSIASTMQSQSHWGEDVPILWTRLESVFKKLQKDNKVYVFSNLFIRLKKSVDLIIENEEELKNALTFFHESGAILFHSETGNIILDVQWFVDAFKCIILDGIHADFKYREFEQLYEHGLLHIELRDKLWQNDNFSQHKDSLVDHMKQLHMLAELSVKLWYVPCMNKQSYSSTILTNCNVSSRFCFLFEFLPFVIYHRLVVACINILEMKPWKSQGKDCIFHTVTILSCKDSYHRLLIAICDNKEDTHRECPYSIEIQINVTKPREIDTELTSSLQIRIFGILNDLTQACSSCEDSLTVGYRCSLKPFGEKSEDHIITQKEMDRKKSEIECSKCVNVHLVNVESILKFWEMKGIVAAIEIGTTYSGFAYSFKDDWTKTIVKQYNGGEYLTYKAPTTLLLNPDKSFCEFGFDAEKIYAELAEEDKHRDYFFFRGLGSIFKTLRPDLQVYDNAF